MDATCLHYDINHLGYYNRGKDVEGYPDIKDCVKELVEWGTNSIQINNTLTYSPSGNTTKHPTYFADGYFDSNHNDAVLVLWKETESNKGEMYGLSRNKKPGAGIVTSTNLDYKKVIPGYPIYFWVKPSEKRIVAIEFTHSGRGKSNLDHYLDGFLTRRAKRWCCTRITKSPDGTRNVEVLGYSPNGKAGDINPLVSPKVNISLVKDTATLQRLIAAQKDITRLQRVESVDLSSGSGVKKTLSEKVSERIYESGIFKGLTNYTPEKLTKVRYKSEVTWKPSVSEIESLYASVMAHGHGKDIENLTAILKDQSRISFFGNAIKTNVKIDLKEQDYDGFLSAQSLHLALHKIK